MLEVEVSSPQPVVVLPSGDSPKAHVAARDPHFSPSLSRACSPEAGPWAGLDLPPAAGSRETSQVPRLRATSAAAIRLGSTTMSNSESPGPARKGRAQGCFLALTLTRRAGFETPCRPVSSTRDAAVGPRDRAAFLGRTTAPFRDGLRARSILEQAQQAHPARTAQRGATGEAADCLVRHLAGCGWRVPASSFDPGEDLPFSFAVGAPARPVDLLRYTPALAQQKSQTGLGSLRLRSQPPQQRLRSGGATREDPEAHQPLQREVLELRSEIASAIKANRRGSAAAPRLLRLRIAHHGV